MSKIKDYGEPWAYNKDRTPSLDMTRPAYQDRDGKTIPGKSTYADDGAMRDRALACVNALAGYDPAALKGLVEACEKVESLGASYLKDEIPVHEFQFKLVCLTETITFALAKLKGVGDE